MVMSYVLIKYIFFEKNLIVNFVFLIFFRLKKNLMCMGNMYICIKVLLMEF